MARSQRLRLSDVKAVYHLVQECRELGADWELWGRHFLEGWAQLLGGNVATMGGARILVDGRTLPIGSMLNVGWSDASGEALFQEYMRTKAALENPAMCRFAALGLPVATRSMEQLLGKGAWHASEHFNQWGVPMGIDDVIFGINTDPGASLSLMTSLHRPHGAPWFERRHRRLSLLLQEELAPLIGTALAAVGEPGLLRLSPRLRQTLLCLLEGDGEKQVAARLELSTATVHQYVGQLYRHFGVNDRAELLALFLRRSGMVARLRELESREETGMSPFNRL